MRIVTENPAVLLRDWVDSDCDSLVRHANDRLVWRNLKDTFPHPYTRPDAVSWVQRAATRLEDAHLAIDLAGEAIGGIGYGGKHGIYVHTAHFGYWLGQAHWGKGIATVAARALKAHAFAHSRLVRLEASVFEWNPASMRVLEKAGFVREGVLRKSALKDGQLIDQVMYATIAPTMSRQPQFRAAYPFQTNVLALPVKDLDIAAAWYSRHFGMTEVERVGEPVPTVILERDGARIGFAVNGGDASQDGAAILVENITAIRNDLDARGTKTVNWRVDERDGKKLQVFFVVAPDGLCYYFHEPF